METFASTRRAALRENLLTAGFLVLVAPVALHFFEGERNPVVLAGFGAGMALVALVFYSVRDAWIGRQVIEIDDEGMRVRGRRREQRIAWAELTAAVHTLRGGERWVLKRGSGTPLVVWMDGFDMEQSARIAERIGAHLPRTERNPAAPAS